MPSKLRRAIGAVKDQTSISLAKVTNAANLEVVILKATTHDEIPIEERYINEIVTLVSSNKVYAAECAQSIGKRIGKTRNWVVALKSLMIILRIFQDGDPYFPREVLHAMKRGSRILNLSGFRDDSSSSPWEYTAFVRLMALYLDERLDCFLTGKLQRRITFNNHHHHHHHHHQIPFKNQKMFSDNVGIKGMKPSILLDKITYWQLLLDRAMGTRPTGEAKNNHLVQISLYAVVQETFDLYRDISDGLAVILDSFFKLPYKASLSAFQACVKSCKQFDELSDFYSFCLSIRVGKSSEYPKVQKVSEELMETLREFLKDQATTASSNIEVISNYNHGQSFSYSSQCSPFSKHSFVSSLRESSSIHRYNSRHDEGYERSYGTSSESCFETASEYASSHCTSLEDLMIATDAAGILTPTPRRFDIDYGGGDDDQDEKQEENNDDDYDASSSYESCSNNSNPINNQALGSGLDLIRLDGVQNEGNKEKHGNNVNNNNNNVSQDCWELVLAETATTTTEKGLANKNAIDSLFGQSDSVPHLQYNPFLALNDTTAAPFTNVIDQTQTSSVGMINGYQNSSEPTVMAPTFTAQRFGFDSDLTSIFGDSNSKTSSAVPTSSFSLQDLAENNMALVPSSRENNHGLDSSTSVSQAQGSFKINPTSSSQNDDSYKMSKASTFTSQGSFKANSASASQGYELYQTSTEPTFNSQGSFKITSISSFQGHDPYQMSTRPTTFDSQDSFKYSSTLTSQSHNSYQTNTTPTFTSQSSFKLSSSSPYQGHDSYQTSIAPSFKTQNSLKNSSTSSFQDHDSHQTSARPTFNSQNSLQFSSASTSQGHDSYKTSTTPTFNPQSSLKNGSTSSFQDHDSHWTSAKPTLNSQNSFKTNSTPSSQTHDSYHSDTAPTFYSHNSYETSSESTFHGHNSSYMMGATPTFHGIHSDRTNIEQSFQRHTSYQASRELAFRTHNPNQVSTEPNFQANNSFQTRTRPTFHGYSSSQMNTESTSHAYNSYLTNTMSPLYGNDSCQMSNGPTFQTHNSYQTNTFTIPSPTFRVQNIDSSMAEARSTIIARNPNNEAMVGSTFWEQNGPNSMAEPTFHAKVSNEALLEAPKEDDPFESWPGPLTNNEDSLKKSMQRLSLEQQKQIWLEQQKRIIEKHI